MFKLGTTGTQYNIMKTKKGDSLIISGSYILIKGPMFIIPWPFIYTLPYVYSLIEKPNEYGYKQNLI